MKSLGLDLSCTTCGFAITENKKLLDAGFFDISKFESYKDKSKIIIEGLGGKNFIKLLLKKLYLVLFLEKLRNKLF